MIYLVFKEIAKEGRKMGTWMRILQRKPVLSDFMLHLLFGWHEETAINGISSKEAHVKCAFANWVSDLWQVWHQAAVPVSLPQDDVHRFQTGCDIGFGDLRSISFQHVGLCGFHVWHRGCQPLPKAQEIVHTIWGKFPVLRKTKRAGGIFLIFYTH